MPQRTPPRAVAAGFRLRAVTRAGWVLAALAIIEHAVVTVEFLARAGSNDQVFLPIVSLVGVGLLLMLLVIQPGWRTGLLYLAGGSVSLGIYVATLGELAVTRGDILILGSIGTALGLVGAVTGGPLAGFLWTVAGAAVTQGTIVGVQIALGLTVRLDFHALIIASLYAVTYLMLWRADRLLTAMDPDTNRVSQAELGEEHLRRQRRAAIIVHETVLRDLAVIAHGPTALSEHDRERVRRHVVQLRHWRDRANQPDDHADAPPEVPDPELLPDDDLAPHADLYDLIREFQWSGLSIDIGGSGYALELLEPEDRAALLGAVRAALDNVAQHSGQNRAELFIDHAGGRVSVMVVDEGVGFDVNAVTESQLGIRMAIRQRVEDQGGTATLWSSPGAGSTVMISFALAEGSDPLA